MASTTATANTTTAMELPVVYVAPGQPLAEVIVDLDSWGQLGDTMRALAAGGARPRLAYAYQLPESDRLLGKLVLDVTMAGAGEAALSGVLSGVRGLRVISVQAPAEAGLVMSERQRPELAGTPAVIFGRPVIGGLARGIIQAQGEAGERLLSQLGGDAGRLAASALPPLIEQLGMTISDDLLARRIRDLQVMGWATFGHASIEDASRGEVTLADTFEAAPWGGEASSPACHFLRGFIAGVFSFVWGASRHLPGARVPGHGRRRLPLRLPALLSAAASHDVPAAVAGGAPCSAGFLPEPLGLAAVFASDGCGSSQEMW